MSPRFGSIVASDPQAIVRMFDPPKNGMPAYRIRLYLPLDDGTFAEHYETVDSYLPTDSAGVNAKNRPQYTAAYAEMGEKTSDIAHPRWPALVEKAIAQVQGGYHNIGTGGESSDIMSMVLGKPGTTGPLPDSDEELLAFLRDATAKGRPVTCGSLDSKTTSDAQGGGFELRDGSYQRTFTATSDGSTSPMEIQPQSLVVSDTKGKAPNVQDDGKGALVGTGAQGTVAYDKGVISIRYSDGFAPAAPEDLHAIFQYRGLVDTENHVYAWHAYIFVRVDDQNRIILRNPWGVEHPKPLSIEAFRASFTSYFSLQPPP